MDGCESTLYILYQAYISCGMPNNETNVAATHFNHLFYEGEVDLSI